MRLTSKARRALPKSDFAIPSKAPGPGSYPIEDTSHKTAALRMVSQFGSPEEKAEVRKKVASKFPAIQMKQPAYKK